MQMIGKERHLYFMGSRLADGSSALILFIDFCPTLLLMLFLHQVKVFRQGKQFSIQIPNVRLMVKSLFHYLL